MSAFLDVHIGKCQCVNVWFPLTVKEFWPLSLSLDHQTIFLFIVLEKVSGATGSGMAEGERGAGYLVRRSGGERGHRGPHTTMRLSNLAIKKKKGKGGQRKVKKCETRTALALSQDFSHIFSMKTVLKTQPKKWDSEFCLENERGGKLLHIAPPTSHKCHCDLAVTLQWSHVQNHPF